jgi:hypothetical protein
LRLAWEREWLKFKLGHIGRWLRTQLNRSVWEVGGILNRNNFLLGTNTVRAFPFGIGWAFTDAAHGEQQHDREQSNENQTTFHRNITPE